MDIRQLNELPVDEAHTALLACCGSERWVQRMIERRPFKSINEVLEASTTTFEDLISNDWLEAFHHHPRIGEKKAAASVDAVSQRWSEQEQSSAGASSNEVRDAFIDANRVYEDRFGFIFIVCASGKSSGEMLELLNARLPNDAETELSVAAEEQRKITELRLRKLLEQ